jgi:hypothetical protein
MLPSLPNPAVSTSSLATNSMIVSCIAGDAGGLRQSFHLEIYSQDEGLLFANITDVAASGVSSSQSLSSPQRTSRLSSKTFEDQPQQHMSSLEATSSDSPREDPSVVYFSLPSLPSESKFRLHIFAVNSRGRSTETVMTAPFFTFSQKQTRGMSSNCLLLTMRVDS